MEALAAEIQHRMESEVADIKKIENGKSQTLSWSSSQLTVATLIDSLTLILTCFTMRVEYR